MFLKSLLASAPDSTIGDLLGDLLGVSTRDVLLDAARNTEEDEQLDGPTLMAVDALLAIPLKQIQAVPRKKRQPAAANKSARRKKPPKPGNEEAAK